MVDKFSQDSAAMAAQTSDKQAQMASSQQEPETLLTLPLKWLVSDQQPKMKKMLQKALQTWFNTNKDEMMVDCYVEDILGDGSAVITVNPSPALTDLQKLNGETLITKDGKKEVAIIQSVIVGLPKLIKQPPDDVSVNSPPSSSNKPADKWQIEEQNDISSAAGQTPVDDKNSSEECIIPVSHYWYMSHAYTEEIKRIEKENKVKLISHFTVKFEAVQEGGTPAEAPSDFTDLVQKCLPESRGSVVPLKYIDPDQWSDALKTIKKNENKFLITMTTDKMTVCGPKQSQDAISATINAMKKTNIPPEEEDSGSRSSLLKIKMPIKDDLTNTGLTMEEDQWKKILSFHEKIATIKSKFNVDFKESSNSQGEINVKAVYNRSGENTAMESHAVRALLQLYQKTLTSPLCFTQLNGATGSNLSQKNFDKDYLSGEASNGSELNEISSQQDNKTPSGEDSKEEQCIIPVSHYWYMSHVYKEEIKRIEKQNIVIITSDVIVKFEAEQEGGTPAEVLSDFSDLVQKCFPESSSSVVPLKYIDPDQWSDSLKIIKKNENKLLVMMTSDKMTVCGPKQSQDAFSETINAMQKTNVPPSRFPLPKINRTIKDPVTYTSPQSLTQPYDASGFNLLLKNFDKYYLSKEASNGYEMKDSKTSGEDSKEERCPICLDSFTNKKRLKCKHEFCEKCLQETKKHQGPICPLCKDVFGVIEGDQPDGTMRWNKIGYPLSGFSDCDHIVITYDIPNGTQTNKHPKPGHYYTGITRQAYLPDNKEGNEVLRLLKKAFEQKLIFTVGTSRTTGLDNQVTWNDIPHKTSQSGGPNCFGYPDPDYLSRVKEELKAKDIE